MYFIELRKLVGTLAVAGAIVCLFLAGQYAFESYMSHSYPVAASPTTGALPVFRCPTGTRVVVLTFDVSWGEAVLRDVMEALETAGAKATFFVTGPWARTHPELIRDLIEHGHEVASLGWSTIDYRQLTGLEVRHELLAARAVLDTFDGASHSFVRPPLGLYGAEVLTVGRSMGYRTILWDVESWDWRLVDPDQLVARVVDMIRPGSIIHFHADDSYPVVPRSIPALVAGLENAGYELRTLGEALETGE